MVEFCSNNGRAILRRSYYVNIERAACVARSATCSVGINRNCSTTNKSHGASSPIIGSSEYKLTSSIRECKKQTLNFVFNLEYLRYALGACGDVVG
jgi:hypothetical protein